MWTAEESTHTCYSTTVGINVLLAQHTRTSVMSSTDVGGQFCLTVGVPVQAEGVGWGGGQGSVQAALVLPHQTGEPFLYVTLCVGALSC